MTSTHDSATKNRPQRTNLTRRDFLFAMLGSTALASHPAQAGVTELVNRALGNQTPTRLAVVLVDITGSIGSDDWALYQRSFEALVSSNRAGDRVVLAAIGDKPISKFIASADRAIPIKHKRLEDETALKRGSSALADDFMQIRAQASTPAQATYVIDTICATGQLFDQARKQKQELTLMILSDMIEESPIANFVKSPPKPATTQSLIAARRRQNLLPDLRDVSVHVIGAGGKTGEHMASVQQFWTTFFDNTHATLKDYGRSPVVLQR